MSLPIACIKFWNVEINFIGILHLYSEELATDIFEEDDSNNETEQDTPG